MDYYSLSRRDLQFLCKKNRVPANLTNVAMANTLHALEIVEGIEEIKEALGFQSPKPITKEEAKIQQQSGSLRRSRRVTTKTGAIKDTPSKDTQNRKFLAFQSPSRTEEVSGNFPKTPAANRPVQGMESQSSRRRGKKIEEVGSHVKAMNATGIVTRRSTRLSSMKALEGISTARIKEDAEEQEREEDKKDEGSKVLKRLPKTRRSARSASAKAAEYQEDGKKGFAASAGDLFVDLVDEDEEVRDIKVEAENDKRDFSAGADDSFIDLVEEEEKVPDHKVEVDNGKKDFAASTGDSFVDLVEEEVNDEQNDSSAQEIKLSNLDSSTEPENGDLSVAQAQEDEKKDQELEIHILNSLNRENLDENSIVEEKDETLEYCCDQSIENNDPEKDTREDESAGLSLDNEAADSSSNQSPKDQELDIHALNSLIEEENLDDEHSVVEEKDETTEHCCEKTNLVKDSRESVWPGNEAADSSNNQSPRKYSVDNCSCEQLTTRLLQEGIIEEENLDDVDSVVEEKDKTLKCCCDQSIEKNDIVKESREEESGRLSLGNVTADSSNNQSPRNDSVDNCSCEQLTTRLLQEGIIDCSMESDGVPRKHFRAVNIVDNSGSLSLENEASDKLNNQLPVNDFVDYLANSVAKDMLNGELLSPLQPEETIDCPLRSNLVFGKSPENVAAEEIALLQYEETMDCIRESSRGIQEEEEDKLSYLFKQSILNETHEISHFQAEKPVQGPTFNNIPIEFPDSTADSAFELSFPNSGELAAQKPNEAEAAQNASYESQVKLPVMFSSPLKLPSSEEIGNMAEEEGKENILKGMNLELMSLTKLRAMYKNMMEREKAAAKEEEDPKGLNCPENDENCNQILNEDMIVNSEKKRSVQLMQEDLKGLSRSKNDSNGKVKPEWKRTPLKNLN